MAEEVVCKSPSPLSAKFKSSFAYTTIRDRLPVILSKVADTVCRKKTEVKEKYGEEGAEDLKKIAGEMSKLRNELQTDKPVLPLEDNRDDTVEWNQYYEEICQKEGGVPKWFSSAWLYVECYMYRRIQQAVEKCSTIRDFDVFQEQKQKSFMDSQQAIFTLMKYLFEIQQKIASKEDINLKDIFKEFLKISLWGNKCDLSISASQDNAQTVSPLDQLHQLEPHLLIDHSSQVWDALARQRDSNTSPVVIDYVLDNAGFEVVSDLCLAEFILTAKLADRIVFHIKAFPWFVSDVTMEDFDWTLDMFAACNNIYASQLIQQWRNRLECNSWEVKVHKFWTMPFPYNEMKQWCPDLYQDLCKSSLIIFKGDLNYRKLVGDLSWDVTTSFCDSLRGFVPAPLCALRTLKCDTVVGLKEGQGEETAKKDKNWMINGNWGVISFAGNVAL